MRAGRSRGISPSAGAAMLLCSLAGAGCYRTTELDSMVPAPETRIVAQLSPTGAEEMATWIGEDAVGLEAHVVRWDGTEVELAMLRVDHRGQRSIQWNGERVVFPEPALRNVRERSLDTGRTAAFVGAVGTAATILAIIFLRSLGFGDNGNGGGTDPVL